MYVAELHVTLENMLFYVFMAYRLQKNIVSKLESFLNRIQTDILMWTLYFRINYFYFWFTFQ